MSSGNSEARVPAWVWLFTGIVTGLFIAFLYYLARVPVPPSDATKEPSQTGARAPTPTPRPTRSFDFYDKLPTNSTRPSPVPMPPASTPPGSRETGRSTASKPLMIIQTGSFQSAQDAQRRRAELLLLGFDVQINQTTIPGSGTWHRVQIGPLQSGAQLDAALATLTENRIDHLVLELR